MRTECCIGIHFIFIWKSIWICYVIELISSVADILESLQFCHVVIIKTDSFGLILILADQLMNCFILKYQFWYILFFKINRVINKTCKHWTFKLGIVTHICVLYLCFVVFLNSLKNFKKNLCEKFEFAYGIQLWKKFEAIVFNMLN